jgi:hypothetical protein
MRSARSYQLAARRGASSLLLLLLLLALAGCGLDEPPPEDDRLARAYLAAYDANDLAKATDIATDELLNAATLARLHAVSDPISGELRYLAFGSNTVKVVGGDPARRETSLFYERPRGDGWVLIKIVTLTIGDGPTRVAGIHFTPMAQTIEEQNRLDVLGKPLRAYVMLACAAAAFVVIVWALVLSFRTPPARRRWLWRIFIAIGFCSVTYNWRAGSVGFNPLYVQLLGMGFSRSVLGPWMLQWSLPIGAVWFLLRRKRLHQPLQES